jgi:signal transduction histidine kinase
MMSVTDTVFAHMKQSDSNVQHQIGQINRNLFQLMRIISNMSDVKSYKNTTATEKKNINLTALFDEIIEKIQTVSEGAQKKISYNGLDHTVIGLANEEQIGRAVYNLLSNALKFSQEGSTINVRLTKNGKVLSFMVCNTTSEPVNDYAIWHQYHRKPTIEDANTGLGLGMTLVSSVACAHGGTVLIDHPTPLETRITMTIPIVNSESTDVRSPIFRIGDYAGGWDKGLLELSEILPADSYQNIN